jgi:hypothetical protein
MHSDVCRLVIIKEKYVFEIDDIEGGVWHEIDDMQGSGRDEIDDVQGWGWT